MRRFQTLAGLLLAICFLCLASHVHAKTEVHEEPNVHKPDVMHDPHGPSPLDLRYDTAIWAVVVFVSLMLILQKTAWKPILEGLQKREETIRSSLEEAKATRAEMEQLRLQFQKELSEAHQQIPKLMEDARVKAEAMKADMIAETNAKLQEDRERLYKDIERAKNQAMKEIWDEATQLATLISAKAIGRALTVEDHSRLLDESLHEMRQTANN